MKAGTMRPWKKLLGIGLLGVAVLLFAKPEAIINNKFLIAGWALVSAYFLIETGRQR